MVVYCIDKIKINVEDESDCAVFVLFDRDAQCILQKPCLDLVVEVQRKGKFGNEGLHPAVLEGLVGKKLLFERLLIWKGRIELREYVRMMQSSPCFSCLGQMSHQLRTLYLS